MNPRDGAVAFIQDVLADAAAVSLRREFWIPAVSLSLIADIVVAAVDWPFRSDLPPPPEHAITVMVLTILAKAWFGLTICRVGLALLRGQVGGLLNHWVPVTMALQVAAVSFVLLPPLILATLCLIVPGVYLMARWSQVVMLLLDGRARWFGTVEHSGALTAGYRAPIALTMVGIGLVATLVDSVVNDITPLAWAWRAVASTFGAALTASLYFQLSRRAPWNPEELITLEGHRGP